VERPDDGISTKLDAETMYINTREVVSKSYKRISALITLLRLCHY
jgi:hypothetical protein